jgi:prolyl oligopeptidase
MDMIRFTQSANGITNISEFGDPAKPDELRALFEMSTYHQVKDGTPYPAILFVHGMNDSRVEVWESGKAAARFQAATSSGKPVLLRLDAQAGHGIGSTVTQRQAVSADRFAFMLWQMAQPIH